MLLLSIFILPILSNFLFFRKKIHLLVGGAGRKVKKRHPEHKGNIVLILLEETEQSEEKTETKEEEHEGKNKWLSHSWLVNWPTSWLTVVLQQLLAGSLVLHGLWYNTMGYCDRCGSGMGGGCGGPTGV